MSSEQQSFNHVKHEEGLHPVVRKTFPSFGEGDVTKAFWVSDEAAILGVMHGRKGCYDMVILARLDLDS
jgi:hypothetical protein